MLSKFSFRSSIILTIFFALSSMMAMSQSNHVKARAKNSIHRVVVQMSTSDTAGQRGIINNIRALKETWGDSVQVEMVVHGQGFGFVLKEKSNFPNEIAAMMKQEVKFVLCRNTMKHNHISEDQVLGGVGFVPSGVVELVLKQEQGWSFLKAGF